MLTFDIKGRVNPDDPDAALMACDAGERSVFMSLTEKTVDFVKRNLRQLGFTGDSMSQLDPRHPQHQSFEGQELEFWCGHDEYNGQTKEKWSISSPRKGVEIQELDGKKARALDALFGSALKENKRELAKQSGDPSIKPQPETNEI